MPTQTERYLRFSSPKTNVAITLPVGWFKGSITEETDYPTDIYFLSPGAPCAPQMIIKIIEIPPAERHPHNYQELSEIVLLEQAQHSLLQPIQIIDQRLEMIGDRPARIDIFNYIDCDSQIPITQYQISIQLDTAVCGVVAMVKTEDQERYIPLFEQAAKSITIK